MRNGYQKFSVKGKVEFRKGMNSGGNSGGNRINQALSAVTVSGLTSLRPSSSSS